MKIKNYLLLSILTILFTGCISSYNIDPEYNEKNKTLFISDYKINSIEYSEDAAFVNLKFDTENINIFKSDSHICKKVIFITLDAGGNRYYIDSAIENVNERYEGLCEIENMGNINFFNCKEKSQVRKNKFIGNSYGLTSSIPSEFGTQSKTFIFFEDNKECFESVKKHFQEK